MHSNPMHKLMQRLKYNTVRHDSLATALKPCVESVFEWHTDKLTAQVDSQPAPAPVCPTKVARLRLVSAAHKWARSGRWISPSATACLRRPPTKSAETSPQSTHNDSTCSADNQTSGPPAGLPVYSRNKSWHLTPWTQMQLFITNKARHQNGCFKQHYCHESLCDCLQYNTKIICASTS